MSVFSFGATGSPVVNNGAWSATGGSFPGVLTDGSDSTYMTKGGLASTDGVSFATVDPSLPSNEVPIAVRARCRFDVANSGFAVSFGLTGAVTGAAVVPGTWAYYPGALSVATQYGPWVSYDLDTSAQWTQSSLNSVGVFAGDNLTSPLALSKVYELGIDVRTASVPSVTVSAPSGTVLDVLKPTITWAHSDLSTFTVTTRQSSGTTRTLTIGTHALQVGNDVSVSGVAAGYNGFFRITAVTGTTISYVGPTSITETVAATGSVIYGDGRAQYLFEVAVYSAAQYGAGGFAPGVSASTWGMGGVSSASSVTVGASLTNATTYRAYVRTAVDTGSRTVYSPWAYSQFTTSATLPPFPTITPTFDSVNNRVAIAVAGFANMLDANTASIETTIGSWSALTNCTVARTTAQASAGAASLSLTSVASGTMSALATGAGGFAVIPGVQYSALADFRAAVSARTCTVKIRWYDSALAFLSDSAGTGSADSTASFGTRTVTATAPGSAAFAAVVVEVASTGAASEVHYVDKAALHPGGTPTWSPGSNLTTMTLARTVGGVVTAVRGTVALDAAQRATVYDYEAPRGAAVTYTVTETIVTPLGTVGVSTAASPITPTSDGRYWLKCMATPALNVGGIRVTGTPAFDREETVGVFRLDGRTDPVVVAGQMYGDDPSFTVTTSTAAEFDAVLALVMHQGTLLLQSPFYDASGVCRQRYVRIVDRSWTEDGVPEKPRTTFTLKALEVGRGY